MAGREVREYTNLSDPKDKKWGKGKDRIDDEDITFQRMVAKEILQVIAYKVSDIIADQRTMIRDYGFYRVDDASRCKRLLESGVATFMDEEFKFAALDSDDLLYLKEQMEAEEDAERLLRRTEKRAFAAFKKAASLADSTPASVPLPLRVEPKPKSGIRQQDLLKKVVEIKRKKPRVTSPVPANEFTTSSDHLPSNSKTEADQGNEPPVSTNKKFEGEAEAENPVKSLLGLAYASSDEED